MQSEDDEIYITVHRLIRSDNEADNGTYINIQYNGDFSSQSLERFVLAQETKPMQQINATVLDSLSDKNPIIVLLYNRSNPSNVHAYNLVVRYYAQNMNDSTIQ